MTHSVRRRISLLILLATSGITSVALGEIRFPNRPGQRDFVSDQALVLSVDAIRDIRAECNRLLDEQATAMVVVTLLSLRDFGADRIRLDGYAKQLFNQWQIGDPIRDGKPWNTGILVLWIKDSGKIRVELGRGWGHAKDAEVTQLLRERFVPQRTAGKIGDGLIAVVNGLSDLTRKTNLPVVGDDVHAPQPNAVQPQHNALAEKNAFNNGPLIVVGLLIVLPALLLILLLVAIARAKRRGGNAGIAQNAIGFGGSATDEGWIATNSGTESAGLFGGGGDTGGGWSGGGADMGSFGGGDSGGGGGSV